MAKMKWRQKLHESWLTMTIKRKIGVFTGVVLFIIFLSVMFAFWVVQTTLNDFQGVLEDNVSSGDYMEAIETESRCFADYIKHPDDEMRRELDIACERSAQVVHKLPFLYTAMSEDRYAKTWSIRNCYEHYEEKRDHVLLLDPEDPVYVEKLYEVYDMQSFLQEYARELIRYTIEDENVVYLQRVPFLRRIPIVALVVGVLLLYLTIVMARLMYKTIIVPIVNLVNTSKRIASNDFFVEDVVVENADEMNDLVNAFNKMKYATGQYIMALEEKKNMMDLLHQEEVGRLEVERHLEVTKLELLKNQINPHFLFNTLNVIGGMANIEGAETSEKMIKALSSLFRYNLKTPALEVTLAQEIRVINDYMYLQKMRFGDRISYDIECDVDMNEVIVPIFSFQPLVENAIIHGLSPKEEGGEVVIKAWQEENNVVFSVADTGVGMTEEELIKIREDFNNEDTSHIGIGNIYKRIQRMYQGGDVLISSKKGEGTVVKLIIPQKKERNGCHV